MIFQIKLLGTIYFDHILKFFVENQINQIKFFIILAVAYYAEARNEFATPISESLHVRATQYLLMKCRRSGEPLAQLCPILPARDLNFKLTVPKTNQLPLHLLAGFHENRFG